MTTSYVTMNGSFVKKIDPKLNETFDFQGNTKSNPFDFHGNTKSDPIEHANFYLKVFYTNAFRTTISSNHTSIDK